MESTRIDRWLWAVRVYRSRSSATAACKAGRVRVNDQPVKAATQVGVGDRIAVNDRDRDRQLEVVRVIEQRVGSPVAVTCFVDHSPPVPPRERPDAVAVRDSGSGRPTKKERRQLDRLRGRSR